VAQSMMVWDRFYAGGRRTREERDISRPGVVTV
jgi:hypothetical protein